MNNILKFVFIFSFFYYPSNVEAQRLVNNNYIAKLTSLILNSKSEKINIDSLLRNNIGTISINSKDITIKKEDKTFYYNIPNDKKYDIQLKEVSEKGWFYIYKIYSQNGILKSKEFQSNDYQPYGIKYFFDEKGNLDFTTDNDLNYKQNYETILKKATVISKKYGYKINTSTNAPFFFRVNPGKNDDYMMISRDGDDEKAYWEITFRKIEKGKNRILNVIIDDKSGKITSVNQGETLPPWD